MFDTDFQSGVLFLDMVLMGNARNTNHLKPLLWLQLPRPTAEVLPVRDLRSFHPVEGQRRQEPKCLGERSGVVCGAGRGDGVGWWVGGWVPGGTRRRGPCHVHAAPDFAISASYPAQFWGQSADVARQKAGWNLGRRRHPRASCRFSAGAMGTSLWTILQIDKGLPRVFCTQQMSKTSCQQVKH